MQWRAAKVGVLAGTLVVATAWFFIWDVAVAWPCLWVAGLVGTGVGRATRRPIRIVLANMAATLAILGVADAAFLLREQRPVQAATQHPRVRLVSGDGRSFTHRHPVLGYAPTPSNVVRQVEENPDGTVHSAVYTMDGQGLRHTPQPPCADDAPEIVFFGCSFTFGDGVQDDETIAAHTARRLGGSFRVLNCAFQGYGPHHMLATLESGLLSGYGVRRPAHIVYQAIGDHVWRAVRGHGWVLNGPRYIPADDTVIRQGCFDSAEEAADRLPGVFLRRSALARSVHGIAQARAVRRLYLRILAAVRQELRSRYPQADAWILLWQAPDFFPTRTGVTALARLGFRVLLVNPLLPTDPEMRAACFIPWNGHPSSAAYAVVADALCREIRRAP